MAVVFCSSGAIGTRAGEEVQWASRCVCRAAKNSLQAKEEPTNKTKTAETSKVKREELLQLYSVWFFGSFLLLLLLSSCSRTLTAVHDSILEDLVYPAEIVGRRTRVRLDCTRLIKVYAPPPPIAVYSSGEVFPFSFHRHLDKNQQTNLEHKVSYGRAVLSSS